MRLFLFTAASNFAIEQTFLHFSLICSTDLVFAHAPLHSQRGNNNECMLHPFLANYIHPFKIMNAFFKYEIQIHYFRIFVDPSLLVFEVYM